MDGTEKSFTQRLKKTSVNSYFYNFALFLYGRNRVTAGGGRNNIKRQISKNKKLISTPVAVPEMRQVMHHLT